MDRRVINVMSSKSKIPFHELGKRPASEIMKAHKLDSRQYVQEVRKHGENCNHAGVKELASMAYKRVLDK